MILHSFILNWVKDYCGFKIVQIHLIRKRLLGAFQGLYPEILIRERRRFLRRKYTNTHVCVTFGQRSKEVTHLIWNKRQQQFVLAWLEYKSRIKTNQNLGSTVGVMTFMEDLEQKEVADSPQKHTNGSPGIEEHFIRK